MTSEKDQQKDISAQQLSFDKGGYNREETLLEIRQMVDRAALLLAGLSSEHERLGWLLQDTLSYLDEIEGKEEVARTYPEIILPIEDHVKVINSK